MTTQPIRNHEESELELGWRFEKKKRGAVCGMVIGVKTVQDSTGNSEIEIDEQEKEEGPAGRSGSSFHLFSRLESSRCNFRFAVQP